LIPYVTIILRNIKEGDSLDENIQLKNRLKVARAEKNLSQEQLAILAGVTRQTISSIETGQYCPTAKLALTLAKVLNKKFEDLFYFEEGKSNE
jgi:putative transcriptional regulator